MATLVRADAVVCRGLLFLQAQLIKVACFSENFLIWERWTVYSYENASWNVSLNIFFLCWFTAKVALVKCRDLHWAMMAHRDQRDVSLSSLRMLIVTDGANPCEYGANPCKYAANPCDHARPAAFRRGISQPALSAGSSLTPFVDPCKQISAGDTERWVVVLEHQGRGISALSSF